MKLEVNKVYSGFIVKHAEYVEEGQSEAYQKAGVVPD